MAPKDENELQHMLYSANQYERLVALRYPRGEGIGVPLDETLAVLPYGKSEVLHEGGEAVLIAIGTMVKEALDVREILAQEGIDLGVVNARFVKPLDTALLDQLILEGKTIFTLEDNVLAGGFGAGVSEYLHKARASNTLVAFGIEDEFVEHGKVTILRQKLGLDAKSLAERMKKILNK